MKKEKYKILRDRKIMLTPLYWNTISQTSDKSRKIFGVNQQLIFSYLKNGRAYQIHVEKYWEKAEKYIAIQYEQDKSFFEKIKKALNYEYIRANKFILKVKKMKMSQLSIDELIEFANNIQQSWLDYDEVNVPSWFWSADYFTNRFRNKSRINSDDFLILSTPDKLTYTSRLEVDLLKRIKLIKKHHCTIEEVAQVLSEKYGWIPFGYDGLEYWDKNSFIKIIKKNLKNNDWIKKIENEIQTVKKIKKQKQNIIKKYNFSDQELKLLEIMNKMAEWTDQRKMVEFKLHYYYASVLLELTKRWNISYKKLKYLFVDELDQFKNNKKEIIKLATFRIKNEFVTETRRGKIRIINDHERKLFLKEFQKTNKEAAIAGIVASKGDRKKYQGTVKIILSPKDSFKINKGDILVATMTSPDYINAMKKASGFITDEGGVTCHAAIVAREMNKPCIIGTKVATKKLKDGDIINIDLEKGNIVKL